MSQKRVYLPLDLFPQEICLSDRTVVHKLKDVVRAREGEKIAVFNGKGKEAEYFIKSLFSKEAVLCFSRDLREENHPGASLVLAFPFLREHKCDLILQKAVELGISRLVPFISSRSNTLSRPSDKRHQRWEKIIIEACRQSLRLWVPELEKVCSFASILERKENLKLFADREGDRITDFKKVKSESPILFLAGPEGGFSSREKEELKNKGFKPVFLSRNVLRTETAAIFMTGLVSYLVNKKG